MTDEPNDPIIERAQYWITQCKVKIKRIRYGELSAMVRSPYATYWYGSLVISPRMAQDLSEDERDFAIVNAILMSRFLNLSALPLLIEFPFLLFALYVMVYRDGWFLKTGWLGMMLMVVYVAMLGAGFMLLMRWGAIIEHNKRFGAVIRVTHNIEAARSLYAKMGEINPFKRSLLLPPTPSDLSVKTATKCLEKAIRVVGP